MPVPPPFSEIFDAHQQDVFNLCLQYLQNRQDAEEATQDVFVKIHEKLPDFKGQSSVKTWAYRISVNHCLDMLRARKRQKRFVFLKSIFGLEGEVLQEPPNFDHPGIQLEERESLEILFKKINELPENQRTALILKHIDDLPQKEIADIMEVSVKAVESLLQRAKQNLEKKIGNTEGF